MTYEEFLAALRLTRREWRLSEFGTRKNLRLDCTHSPYPCCPLTSLRDMPHNRWCEVATDLGLDAGLARKIICSADEWSNQFAFDPKIRQDLLLACGLSD